MMYKIEKNKKLQKFHLNYSIISEIIEPHSSVLDLGCGSGELLKLLEDKKNIIGRGIEINQDEVISCIEKGLSVFQGNIDEGLNDFDDNSFDYVILNQTLQSTNKPDFVLKEMLRVGKKGVISFPNFAYWRVRFELFFTGHMPKSKVLPFEWYNTPNIHLLTLKDFQQFAKVNNININQEIYIKRNEEKKFSWKTLFPNFYAEEVMFVVSKSN